MSPDELKKKSEIETNSKLIFRTTLHLNRGVICVCMKENKYEEMKVLYNCYKQTVSTLLNLMIKKRREIIFLILFPK